MQLLHYDTSKKLWNEAQSLVTAHTTSQIIYLKFEFHNTKKGERKTKEYLVKMKNLIDKLKLASNHVSNSNLIIQAWNDLYFEYNPIMINLFDQVVSNKG